MSKHLTLLIDSAAAGDSAAAEKLLPLIYDELRKLASANMNKEIAAGAGQTLQPTGLVHEAYLRLLGPGGAQTTWKGRGHFFGRFLADPNVDEHEVVAHAGEPERQHRRNCAAR